MRKRARSLALVRGFSCELYRRLAPKLFKTEWSRLRRAMGSQLRSIQIFSNNPAIPWELMRPVERCTTQDGELLGVQYLVARWHVGDHLRQLDRPNQQVPLRLFVVAPRYEGDELLPFQRKEVRALSRMPSSRLVSPASYAEFGALVGRSPPGIIHFSGHGLIERYDGIPRFTIKLEDGALDVPSWRGLFAGNGHPFYFFNACDTGQAESVVRFVEGWAPAVLDAGASGFIGGMWPLFDESAADFAVRFYGSIARRITADRPVAVAEALREARRQFFETGDPTYLAYTFYGDVNLHFVPE